MSKIIGIDLGTTNSAMAYMSGGKPNVIANAQGGRLTPSVVAKNEKGEIVVGQPAKNQAITNPEGTDPGMILRCKRIKNSFHLK